MIAKKAPESQHYSGSGSLSSLSFRVAAAIAQKNGERDFIVEVIPNALAITTTACHQENGQSQDQDILTVKELDNRHNKLHGRQNSIGCVQKNIDSLHWYCRNYMKAQHTKRV
uniref:Uncharacterized protein n=1 Tax=Magallana gigas TaxID=29159 RepID=K1PS64_MAGGI